MKSFLDIHYKILLSPRLLGQEARNWKGKQKLLRSFAILLIVFISLSWTVGIFIISLSNTSQSLFQVGIVSIIHFYFIWISAVLIGSHIEYLVQKKYPSKSGHSHAVKLLWLFSGTPWLFFSAFAVISQSTDWFWLMLFGGIWLFLWSIYLFILSVKNLYDLVWQEIRQILFQTLIFFFCAGLLVVGWFSNFILSVSI